MVELRGQRSEVRDSRDAMRRRSYLRLRLFDFGLRPPTSYLRLLARGVTLIELLIAIAIIATLATLFLGASNAAMESARAARTKTTIHKIHTLLMERWDSYRTRRVDINPTLLTAIERALPDPDDAKARGEALADLRLLATRELMKFEMPDRWSDIIGDTVSTYPHISTSNLPTSTVVLATRPSITRAYLRSYLRINNTATEEEVLRNQGAECLYLIVMLHTGDGEARTLFSRQDIGDTDGDGALELLDGWGRPIHFIRWPAGFVNRSDLMSGDANSDHDPFDPFGRDQYDPYSGDLQRGARPPASLYPVDSAFITALSDPIGAFRLVPLVYSAGGDGITDINNSGGFVTGLDPYALDPDPPNDFQFGVPEDDQNNPDGEDNSIDNIHNHLQDGR